MSERCVCKDCGPGELCLACVVSARKQADISPVRRSDYEWCAKIAVQRMESADQIESLLIHQFRGNRVALLAYLGIEGEAEARKQR